MIFGLLLRRLWPYIAIAALLGLTLLFARRVGKLEQLIKIQEMTIRMNREMRDAGDATPVDKRSVLERLRAGNF